MRAGTLRSGRLPSQLLLFAFTALLWLARFSPPPAPSGVELDQSWQQAYPYFHSRGLQVGIDYVFTYGPLGFLEVGTFTPELFWMRTALWEVGFELAIAILFALAARGIPSTLDRVLFMLASLLAAVASDTYSEAYRTLAIAIVGLSLLGDPRQRRGRLFACSFVLAILSLVKFPYFILSVVTVITAAFAMSLRKPRSRGLGLVAAYASTLVAVWVASGQRLAAFPRYLSTSFELAAGFSQGMYRSADPHALALALAALAMLSLALVIRVLVRPRGVETALACALLGLATLLAYKSSFVLFDNDGAFASFATAVVFLIPPPAAPAASQPSSWIPRLLAALRYGCVAVGLLGAPSVVEGVSSVPTYEVVHVGYRWRDAWGALRDLRGFKASQQFLVTRFAPRFDLPRIRSIVADEPVDVVGVYQGVALLNGFNYHPRPVFQNYAAYTPELMELNRRFVAGETAARFMISRLWAMPWRLPALEDASTFQALVRDFEPLVAERGFVLWKRVARSSDGAAAERATLVEGTFRLGDWIKLEGGDAPVLVASIHAEPTWLGRMRSLAYQPAELVLEVLTSFGDSRSFRLGLQATRTSFVLDPLICENWDFVRWVAGIRVPRPRMIRVLARGGDAALFQSELQVRIDRADDLRPRRPPGAPEDFAFSMFFSHPTQAVVGPFARTELTDDGETLTVGAPSELRFEVQPGDHTVEALFGLSFDPDASSYGVSFSVVLEDGERTLFEKTLDPRKAPVIPAPQALRLKFRVDRETRLLLRTRTGPHLGKGYAYWSEIAIDAPGAAERMSQVRMR